MDTQNNCKTPFISSDFERFDKVADGRLYLSEIDEEELSCIIEHLIRTKDPMVRDEFLSMLQNDLWEAVRERLLALKEGEIESDETRQRVDDLLEIDYSDDRFVYSTSVEYSYSSNRRNISSDGYQSRYRLGRHGLSAAGELETKFDIDDWKLENNVGLNGSYSAGAENESFFDGSPAISSNNNYWGLNGYLGSSILRRDESIKISLFGTGDYYRDPPPGELEYGYGVGGELSFQEIGASPFSLNASTGWEETDSAPIDETLFDPKAKALYVSSEISYMFDKAGLLLTYDHSADDEIVPMMKEESVSNSAAAIAHIDLEKGHVRAGAGGGHWREDSAQISGEPSDSSGGEVHGLLSGMWRPIETVKISPALYVYANQSDGTFQGWFPSAIAMLSAEFTFEDFAIGLGGGCIASYRDLNEYQTHIEYETSGSIAYFPTDFFMVSLSGAFSAANQDGYDEYDMTSWYASPDVSFRIHKNPDLWFVTRGLVNGNEYTLEGYFQEDLNASIITSLRLRY